MFDAFGKRSLGRIKDFNPCFHCFVMQVPTPAFHAVVCKLWLPSMTDKSQIPCIVIAFNQNDTRIRDRPLTQCLLDEGYAHLPFKKDRASFVNNRPDPLEP